MIQFDTDKYVKIDVADGLLEAFEEDGYTYLHCTYYNTNPKWANAIVWWVNIHATSYLVDSKTGEKLQLLNAINIPLSPDKHLMFTWGETHRFTLIFHAIPKHWSKFNFVEKSGTEDGLSIGNIPRNNIGVYSVMIR